MFAMAATKPAPLSPRVLIVDDDPDARDQLRDALHDDGYRILAVTSSAARELGRQVEFDVVLAELDDLVEARRANPDAVRIFVTATPSLDSAVRAINEAGVHRYVAKPWKAWEVRAMIREALATRARSAATHGLVDVEDLSPRLTQTLDALMTGASEKQVALQLGISHHTAHQYVKMLFRRFGVSSRAELMAKCLRR
jgi:DNA-binding NarL/FixJ family response regulator